MSQSDGEAQWCRPQGVDNRQIVDVIVSFLREFPRMRHSPAISLVEAALMDSFPCP